MTLQTNENETNEHIALNFKTLKNDPSESSGDILLDNSCNSDLHVFNTNIQNLDTPYILPEEFQNFLDDNISERLPILHLNIRSINKNFETFKNFLSTLNYNFSIICFSETWLEETNNENSNYELPGYYSIHQIRNNRKGDGISIHIKKVLNFKIKDDLSINCKDVESLCIELLFENKRNTLIYVLYRPYNGQTESFEKFLKNVFSITKNSNKVHRIAGDFNLNLLNHENSRKVQGFLNLIYQNGMIPTRNKPTRVIRKTATAINHILTNSFIDTTIKVGIIKSDVSDHFPIYLFIPSEKVSVENEIVYIYKKIINDETIEAFTQNLYENNLNDVESIRNPNDAYRIFLEQFRTMYDKHFPLKTIKLKTKDLKSPWITAGIKKSSKQKQRLYTKFLKNRNQKNETEYKNYKKLFESIKRRLKKLHLSKLLLKCKNNIKKLGKLSRKK